jgi:hypothetical protein
MKTMQLVSENVTNPACNQVEINVLACKPKIKHHFYIHPGMLTACKKNLLPGGTGELVRSTPYSLTYTRLGPQNYILSLEHSSAGTVHSENVKGHECTVLNSNPDFLVAGFDTLTEACFLREFYIPRICFPQAQIAPFAEKHVMQQRLMSIATNLLPEKAKKNLSLHSMMLLHTMLPSKPASSTDAVKNGNKRSLLSMNSAKRMLYFNRNATSRMRSLFHNKPLNFARNLCLSVALAHRGKHRQQGMLLMHTMQYVPLSELNKQALAQLKLEKPVSNICYLSPPTEANCEPGRNKVFLYQIPPSILEDLKKDGLVSRAPLAYLAFSKENNQPLFIGNVDSLTLEAKLHPKSASTTLKEHGQADNRPQTTSLWLHAAATEHKLVSKALPSMLHSLSLQTEHRLFAKHTAFELWHSATLQ